MTPRLELEASIENLVATYIEVGGQVEGASIERLAGLVVCRSPLAHPLANFAICRSDGDAAKPLGRFARPSQGFNLYLLPGSGQRAASAALRRSGWRNMGSLQMLAGGRPRGTATASLRGLTEFSKRLEAARFLCQTFFPRLDSTTAEAIAQATAKANVELRRVDTAEPTALVMTSRQSGSFGIYSLCVEPSLQRRGIGSAVLESTLQDRAVHGLTAVLQCEAGLVRWYRAWGFVACGEIRIFA